MTCTTFEDFICYNEDRVISVEEAIRHCCAHAGAHRFSFENQVSDAFANLDDWTVDAGTWVISSSQLDGTGAGGGSTWYRVYHDTEVEPPFLATFDVVSGSGGFAFHGKTTDDYYVAFWDASDFGFQRIASGTPTIVSKVPFPSGSRVPLRLRVAVWWVYDSIDEDRKWLAMSMAGDGTIYDAHMQDVSLLSDWDDNYVGFAVYESDNLVIDNLDIQDLSGRVEYVGTYPGEAVGAGLRRAIGGTRVTMAARYDGTVRAWIPGNRDLDWTVGTNRELSFIDRKDFTSVGTHIRVIGAIHSTEKYDDDEGEVHMHRFVQTDDPNLMSEEECQAEAVRAMGELEEMQYTISLIADGCPFVEVGDIISYDSTSYRVLVISHAMEKVGRGMGYKTRFDCRKYVAI